MNSTCGRRHLLDTSKLPLENEEEEKLDGENNQRRSQGCYERLDRDPLPVLTSTACVLQGRAQIVRHRDQLLEVQSNIRRSNCLNEKADRSKHERSDHSDI